MIFGLDRSHGRIAMASFVFRKFINKERKNKIITVYVTDGFKLFLDEDVVS